MVSQALLEPYLNSTTFMYVSSTNSSRFKRSHVVKSRCQSCHRTPIQAFQKIFRERRGRPVQGLATAWHACSASASTSRAMLPDESQRLAHSLFISPFPLCHPLPHESGDREAMAAMRQITQTEHHCPIPLNHSTTVSSSTSSTSPKPRPRLR